MGGGIWVVLCGFIAPGAAAEISRFVSGLGGCEQKESCLLSLSESFFISGENSNFKVLRGPKAPFNKHRTETGRSSLTLFPAEVTFPPRPGIWNHG